MLMKSNQLISRRVRYACAAIALAFVAAACGAAEEAAPEPAPVLEPESSTEAPADVAPVEREPSNLRVASFGGILDGVMKELFAGFEEEYKITIEWESGSATGNVAKAQATAANPEWDIIFTEDTNQAAASGLGLLAPVDTSIVTNYEDLVPAGRGVGDDGVSFGLNPTAMYYRPDVFKANGWAPPTDWEDLFRPEFCGKIGMNHPNVTYTLHVAELLGGGDMLVGIGRLADLAECITVFEPTSPSLEEKILLGEYVIGTHGQIRLVPMSRQVDLALVYPETMRIGLSFASPVKDAPNPEGAQLFLEWLVRPESQRVLVDTVAYLPSNGNVDFVPEFEGAPDMALAATWSQVEATLVNANRRQWADLFDRIIAR